MLTVINTFIAEEGVKIPFYTAYSLAHLRILNPESRIYFICHKNHGLEKMFSKFGITHVDVKDIKGDLIDKFEEKSVLKHLGRPNTKYPSPNLFFHNAMSRLFYLEEFARQNSITDFIHTENDVLTYYSFEQMYEKCDYSSFVLGLGFWCTQLTEQSVTLAFSQMETKELRDVCSIVIALNNNQELFKCQSKEMFNEMSAIYLAPDISFLPIVPNHSSKLLFDPGSYGQYLDGTNNEHGKGWYGKHHIIGAHIAEGNIDHIIFDKREHKPYVDGIPLFNLHLHSKNLKPYSYEGKLFNW